MIPRIFIGLRVRLPSGNHVEVLGASKGPKASVNHAEEINCEYLVGSKARGPVNFKSTWLRRYGREV